MAKLRVSCWVAVSVVTLSGCLGDTTLDLSTAPTASMASGRTLPEAGVPPRVLAPPPDALPGACEGPAPLGFTGIRRLTRVEYDNTLRDLLGDDSQPSSAFPPDDPGLGFDNHAGLLKISALHVEKYEAAAVELIDRAWERDFVPGFSARFEAEDAVAANGVPSADGTMWRLTEDGSVGAPVTLDRDGQVTISVRAGAARAGSEFAKMVVRIDDGVVAQFTVDALPSSPKTYAASVQVPQGSHQVSAELVNHFKDLSNPDPDLRRRDLYVDWVEVQRSPWSSPTPVVRVCDPAAQGEAHCRAEILRSFASRAFRRPVGEEELGRWNAVATAAASAGADFDASVRHTLGAMLLSPHFLFRIEGGVDGTAESPLEGHALASRLSYLLWSSMPDETLTALAQSGELADPAVLWAQAERMLEDPKASAFVDNFAGQWLPLRALEDAQPDPTLHPHFDDALRVSAREETRRLFREVMNQDLPATMLLDADFTFVDARLAAHYGLPAPAAGEWVKVQWGSNSLRRGVLGHTSVLTATSYPDRTSPVKRGQWVLGQLLCEPPAPPPPGVENLETAVEGATMRERMAAHRTNPACAGCHALMDPIGLGLEQFDATGRDRQDDGEGAVIDPAGTLPDGRTFEGPVALAGLLADDPRVSACITTHLFSYASGRTPTAGDECAIAAVHEQASSQGGSMKDVLRALLRSRSFTHTSVEGEAP